MYDSRETGGYFPGHHTQHWPDRQYPKVNPKMLNQSAQASKQLMGEASTVLNKLASSEEFSSQLMSAAQQSQTEEVERLIHSLGVKSDVDIHYNPDGLRIEFKSNVAGLHCCTLSIALRWR
jgi:uncharacterized protein with von Willebrand factor type A (vWA) domain